MRDGNPIALVELFQRVAVLQTWLQISHKVLAEVMIWFRKRWYLNIIQKDTEHDPLRHPPWHEGNIFFYIDLSMVVFLYGIRMHSVIICSFLKMWPKKWTSFIKVSDFHLWQWSGTQMIFSRRTSCVEILIFHLLPFSTALPFTFAWTSGLVHLSLLFCILMSTGDKWRIQSPPNAPLYQQ